MATKVSYNNIAYDILDAIPIGNREYLIISNPDDKMDLRYIEKANIDGEDHYYLPPKDFSIENNPKVSLKRLQINSMINHVVDIIKQDISSGNLRTDIEIKKQLLFIESFLYTDPTVKGIIADEYSLNPENYSTLEEGLNRYLDNQFLTKTNTIQPVESADINKLEQPIITKDGLNSEWLYELSSAELKEMVNSKSHTSEELIYILDALDKSIERERISDYTSGNVKVYANNKISNRAAFADLLLLSFITASFGILLLIALF